MTELNMDAIREIMRMIEEKYPKPSIEMILLTNILSKKEVYQLEYKDKKYLCIPYQTWDLILKEVEPKSFCNHDFVSYLCETYAGIPICKNDELVVEIMTDICKRNKILNNDSLLNKIKERLFDKYDDLWKQL
jgi:hypothetical protein